MSRIIHHHSLDIHAPEEIWRALGWVTYSEGHDVAGQHAFSHNIDGLLAEALIAGKRGEECLAWAVAETRRKCEASEQNNAILQEAKSISELANAIKKDTDAAVLEKIIGRLSERTQYAVRKQLAGTGLIR